MKLIVQDEDLVDKEDTGILDRMAQFASGTDVVKIAAAKQLSAAIKRVVRQLFFCVQGFLNVPSSTLGTSEKRCHSPQSLHLHLLFQGG